MSNWRRSAWLAVGMIIMVLVIGAVAAWQSSRDGAAEATGVVRNVAAARAPFTGWTAGTISVGDRTLSVVVADDSTERIQGLREKRDATPYEGMLFVYSSPLVEPYTMATVLAPLEITFFDARGRVVDRIHMTPCNGTDATCPSYKSEAAFQYALETPNGVRYRGRLAVGRTATRMTVTPRA